MKWTDGGEDVDIFELWVSLSRPPRGEVLPYKEANRNVDGVEFSRLE